MTRALSIPLGLLGLVALKLLGDALSLWLDVQVPGSFWGFLLLLLALTAVREAPKALFGASSWLLNHLTLFLLPSMVAAVVGLRFTADVGASTGVRAAGDRAHGGGVRLGRVGAQRQAGRC